MRSVVVVEHPLVQRDLALLRAKDTPAKPFRGAMRRIAHALALRALEDVRHHAVEVETPLETARGIELDETVALVPILRAGLGLVDGFLDAVPDARVCHLGMVRDDSTLEPTCYLSKLDSLRASDRVYVLDPMLATGGSAVAALELVREKIDAAPTFVALLAAPEGIERLHERHPDVPILTAAIDRELDERGYICPGLGDAGDRFFGA